MMYRIYRIAGYSASYGLLTFSLFNLFGKLREADAAFTGFWLIIVLWDIRLVRKWHAADARNHTTDRSEHR